MAAKQWFSTIVLHFLINISISFASNKSDVILLIKDFIEYYQHPNMVYTYTTCWGKDLRMDLEKTLKSLSVHSEVDILRNQYATVTPSYIFVDMFCDTSISLMEKMQNGYVFTPSQPWLLLLNNSDSNIRNYYFPISSSVYFIEESDNGYLIKTVYKTSPSSLMVQKPIGNWTKAEGFIELYNRMDEMKVRNIMRERIKISYVLEDMDAIAHLNDYQYNILTDTTTKLNYVLIQHLLRIINGTKAEEFRKYYEKTNNLDDGMIDDLKSGHFDIGGTPIELLSSRIDELDVLAKTAPMENKFIFRATPHSYISNVFTLPFDAYVWYSSFGLIAVIFFVTYVVVYWEWKDPVFKRYITPRLCLRPHPVDIFLMEVGSAAQQGFETEPRSNSGRIVFILTLISLMFLYTSFSASIVALLQSTTESLNTLENLLESRIPVGFKENISMDYFDDLNYENKSNEFYNKLRKPLFLPIEKGIKRVQKDFFAFYADTAEIYKYVKDMFLESEKCSLREIPFKNTYVDHWLFMKKDSDYRDILRVGMNKIDETGIRSREYRRLFTSKPSCDSVGGNFESVGLADSYGAFLVMGVGIALSVFLFLIEKLWVRNNLVKYVQRVKRWFLHILRKSLTL